MGPEDRLEVDNLAILLSSNGHKHVVTRIDVFSRYLRAYPTQDMAARTDERCLIDVLTRHCYLSTVLLTDEGLKFRSEVENQIAQTLDKRISHASTHQSINKQLESFSEPSSPLETSLKTTTEERRSIWHKYVQLAVTKYNTKYRDSLDTNQQMCSTERSRTANWI